MTDLATPQQPYQSLFNATPPAPVVAVEPLEEPTVVAQLELFMGDLTLGMMEDLEVALGWPMSEAQDRPGGGIRLACAMIYVRRKVLDPTYTMEQARELPPSAMVQFAEAMGADAAPPQNP